MNGLKASVTTQASFAFHLFHNPIRQVFWGFSCTMFRDGTCSTSRNNFALWREVCAYVLIVKVLQKPARAVDCIGSRKLVKFTSFHSP